MAISHVRHAASHSVVFSLLNYLFPSVHGVRYMAKDVGRRDRGLETVFESENPKQWGARERHTANDVQGRRDRGSEGVWKRKPKQWEAQLRCLSALRPIVLFFLVQTLLLTITAVPYLLPCVSRREMC